MITCNAVKRGSKVIPLKGIVDAGLTESARNGISVGGEITAYDLSTKLYSLRKYVSVKGHTPFYSTFSSHD